MKSMEGASALHQPDGVGSQGCHIGSLVELNGVSIALMARSGVFSYGSGPRRCYGLVWDKGITTFHDVGW